ncbi:hypothetical protein PM082_007054 [Marasmius tenuissimus]|nr:hypothetical protein PM082_007054 [Marasmius tenuissimus]
MIQTFNFWMSIIAEEGWKRPDTDLLWECTKVIMKRTVDIDWQCKTATFNNHFYGVWDLACTTCALISPPPLPTLPQWINLAPMPNRDGKGIPKCSTRIAETPLPAEEGADLPESVIDPNEPAYSGNHGNREKECTTQSHNLKRLISTHTGAKFWKVIRKWTDEKSRLAKVTAQQLKEVFKARLNPIVPAPTHFHSAYQQLYDDVSAAIPLCTTDHSAKQVWSHNISEAEVTTVKEKLKHSIQSVVGANKVTYKTISHIPNDILTELFQACLDRCDSPSSRRRTVLIGILKKNKDPTSADSYRIIGLESCLLKSLTLILDG